MNKTSLRKGKNPPRCIVIAGPNGAGKTTFAREFLHRYAEIIHFVNADLIADGLSPLRPQLAAIRAGRLLLTEIDRLARSGVDFAFESTLAGIGHLERLKRWKENGYRIEIIYLTLPSAAVAIRRVASRVREGGHDIPRRDLVRRFHRSWENFQQHYCRIADAWLVYDNSGDAPVLVAQHP